MSNFYRSFEKLQEKAKNMKDDEMFECVVRKVRYCISANPEGTRDLWIVDTPNMRDQHLGVFGWYAIAVIMFCPCPGMAATAFHYAGGDQSD